MEKIVVTPLMGMGDTLMTTPALQLIKENRPDCEITYFTFNRATQEVLLNNPHIDHLHYHPIKAVNFVKATLHVLTHFSFRFDTCINFYPSNRIQYNAFAFMTGAKMRIGHTYLKKYFSQLNWLKNRTIREDYNAHCVVENIRLLKFLGIEADTEKIPPMHIYLTDDEKFTGESFRESMKHSTIAGIHTGTSTFKNQDKRRWPKEYFVRLIDSLPDIHFVMFGALDELEINRSIQSSVKNSGQVTVVDNKTLREVAAIIGKLDAFISNDSGLMHIAAAMNTPTLAILGPTNQNFIHPWNVKHKIARLELPCSPCFYYSPKPLACSLKDQFKCLSELEPPLVEDSLVKLLEKK